MQLLFRLIRVTVLIQTEVADQVSSLDRDGGVEDHDPVRRQRFPRAVQSGELYPLRDPFQLAKFASTADGDDRAFGQFADFLAVQARFRAHLECTSSRFDAMLAVHHRLQEPGREVTAQRSIGIAQAGRAQAVFQTSVLAVAADAQLGAAGQEVSDLVGPGAVVNVHAALFGIVRMGLVRRGLDPVHFAPESRPFQVRIVVILHPILQVQVQAVEDQARRLIGAALKLRRLQVMTDQHEVAREGFFNFFIDEVRRCRRVRINAVSHHFAVGQAVHAGLLQAHGGTAVEMHAAVPQAIAPQGVVTGVGVGQVGQLLQRGARVLEWVAPVFQRWQAVGFRGRRWGYGLGFARWPDRGHGPGGG
ncbi:hypothetical protein D3C76_888090 [compost metagenome]